MAMAWNFSSAQMKEGCRGSVWTDLLQPWTTTGALYYLTPRVALIEDLLIRQEPAAAYIYPAEAVVFMYDVHQYYRVKALAVEILPTLCHPFFCHVLTIKCTQYTRHIPPALEDTCLFPGIWGGGICQPLLLVFLYK